MGRELALLIHQINQGQPTWTIVGFFDDGVAAGQVINNIAVLGNLTTLNQWPNPLAVVMAIGNPTVKRSVVGQLTNTLLSFPTLIHPSVALTTEHFCTMGAGSVLSAGTRLTTNITIGRHVFVNLNCTIGHDAVIGDFSALMPGVHVSGEVMLGAEVYVGTGAVLRNRVSVGDGTTVGAGAVVVQSLPGYCTAVGTPARPIRFHPPPD